MHVTGQIFRENTVAKRGSTKDMTYGPHIIPTTHLHTLHVRRMRHAYIFLSQQHQVCSCAYFSTIRRLRCLILECVHSVLLHHTMSMYPQDLKEK